MDVLVSRLVQMVLLVPVRVMVMVMVMVVMVMVMVMVVGGRVMGMISIMMRMRMRMGMVMVMVLLVLVLVSVLVLMVLLGLARVMAMVMLVDVVDISAQGDRRWRRTKKSDMCDAMGQHDLVWNEVARTMLYPWFIGDMDDEGNGIEWLPGGCPSSMEALADDAASWDDLGNPITLRMAETPTVSDSDSAASGYNSMGSTEMEQASETSTQDWPGTSSFLGTGAPAESAEETAAAAAAASPPAGHRTAEEPEAPAATAAAAAPAEESAARGHPWAAEESAARRALQQRRLQLMSVGSSGQQGAYGGTLGAAASELGAVGQAADGQVPCCEHPLPSAVEDVVFWASPAAHINPDGESSGSPGLPPAP